jgi:hypothetical protein
MACRQGLAAIKKSPPLPHGRIRGKEGIFGRSPRGTSFPGGSRRTGNARGKQSTAWGARATLNRETLKSLVATVYEQELFSFRTSSVRVGTKLKRSSTTP